MTEFRRCFQLGSLQTCPVIEDMFEIQRMFWHWSRVPSTNDTAPV